MYRVYVIKQRKGGSEVIQQTRTQTYSFTVAATAFHELQREHFDNSHLLLMTKNNRQINAYRYESVPGDRDYLELNAELNS